MKDFQSATLQKNFRGADKKLLYKLAKILSDSGNAVELFGMAASASLKPSVQKLEMTVRSLNLQRMP